MVQLQYKNENHESLYKALMTKLNITDRYGITFCYLASATYKFDLLNYVCCGNVHGDEIIKMMMPFSKSEQMLITLALHFYNYYYKCKFSIDDLFTNLDKDNKMIVLNALKLKYLNYCK